MAQLVKRLTCQCEDLSSDPQDLHKKLGVVALAYNSSNGKMGGKDGGITEVRGPDSLAYLKSQFNKRPYLKG